MTTTAGTTSRGYRYPGDASATDVPGDLKKLADDVNADVTAVAANGAVTTAKIADSAVTSAKIADGTIVAGDLADGAVTSAKIAAGTIVSSDLATSAVATSNIADSAVTSAKIADGTIVDADINAAAGIAKTKITGTALVESTATTKGDLLARGTSDVERLAVGAVGTNPILIPDTSASAGVKWGTWTEADVAQASKVGNLLTLNQATLETSTTGWSGYQVTLTRDTGTYYQGAASLKVASSTSSFGTKVANTSSTIPVTAGRVYTAQAQIKTDGVTYARVGVLFYSGGSPSGSVTYGNTVTATTWTASTVTATAPANADAVYVYVYLDPAAASGTYAYADALGMWAGAGGLWAPPGTPIANLGTYTDETVGRRIFTWDTANNRWQMTYGDTGWREINALQTAAALTKFPNAVLSVRRVNSSVDVRWFSDTGTVAGAAVTAICSTLTGFRPGVIQGRGIVGSAVNVSSGLPSVHGVYSDGAALNIATTADSANNVLASLSYTTNDSWPTALPGNAIGTIPQ